ncbi:MAG: LCP family protein [Clostridiales bacterium]|nr:LCP family protein [Clostridiales bacterium]
MAGLFFAIYTYAGSILKDEVNYAKYEEIITGLKEPNVIEDIFKPVAQQVNFIVMCTDEDETRTDLMVIGSFLTREKKLNFISLPRDLYVELTEEQEKVLLDNDRFLPSRGYLKLTELHHYAGPELGVEMLVNEIEDTFDINIDYYAKLNLQGFRSLVDDMGGIYFNVPQRMFYDDFTQDLWIDLYPGEQLLDGAQAEGLLRYRKPNYGYESISPSYTMGDLERLEVQQAFIKEFIMQLLSKDDLINNGQAVINAVSNYVTTNFNINEVPKYLKYIKDIEIGDIETHTIPVKAKIIGGNDSEFIQIDMPNAEGLIGELFFGQDNIKTISSKGKRVKILNGGYIDGMAAKKRDLLQENGFEVAEIGSSMYPKNDHTFIYVNKEGLGYDLKEYFAGSRVKYDKNLKDYDIIIVIGAMVED